MVLAMASPKKAGSGSWLGFAWAVASVAAKKTFTRMREEYVAGREGEPSPRPPVRRAAPAGPPWWQVLQVSPTARLEQITVAYRELIRKNHPDKVAHLSEQIRRVADQETRRINAAYEAAQQALGRKR
jgi:DnaJ-domain-containing protein 1